MSSPDLAGAPPRPTISWLTNNYPLLLAQVAGVGIVAGVASGWSGIASGAVEWRRVVWVLPALVVLHLGQLLLSGVAWRGLFSGPRPGTAVFYRLRIIREGIDSLLPVAQVGGEIVGARLLSRRGVPLGQAGASVIVDVTIEFLTQLAFLAAGLCALAWLSRDPAVRGDWLGMALAGAGVVAALVLTQRLGLLRLLERLTQVIAGRWPALGGASLDGLHAAAVAFYRRPAALLQSVALHLLAWVLGSLETWAVLNLLGVAATPLQAFTVESLGMAARSAGFAIPAALGAQEGGFVLAAASLGLPVGPALALSLVKRVREITVGLIGMALWRSTAARHARS